MNAFLEKSLGESAVDHLQIPHIDSPNFLDRYNVAQAELWQWLFPAIPTDGGSDEEAAKANETVAFWTAKPGSDWVRELLSAALEEGGAIDFENITGALEKRKREFEAVQAEQMH